jgi:phospho-N-acetylmuramoyl-pentapeptide-transferase
MNGTALTISLAGIGFLLAMIWGGVVVRLLRRYGLGQQIQIYSAGKDIARVGTPTMGGILILLTVTLITLLQHIVTLMGFDLLGFSILLPLATMLAFGALGLVSDWRHIRGVLRGGLPARTKLIIQIVLAAGAAYGLQNVLDVPNLYLPLYRGEFELGFWYLPIATLLIAGASNAVNLTGGVNGLPGLMAFSGFAIFGSIALLQGQIFLARFCFTVVGATLGFLWFNIKPAAMIIGNTGTFALGAALGVVALMTGHWILLPFIAFIPMLEVLSVVLQVGHYKYSGGQRLLRMAPLHYHLNLSGWSDTQIVQRFFIVNALVGLIGFTFSLL